jgi:hypothetical protein
MRAILLCVIALIANIAKADLNTISNSICKISSELACGSGFAYKEDKLNYFILTAGHITGIATTETKVSLFHSGAMFEVPATTIFHKHHDLIRLDEPASNGDKTLCIDVAVLQVGKDSLTKIGYPNFDLVKFGLGYKGKPNTLIWNYGCPSCKWPTAFKGRLVRVNNSLLEFTPTIMQGRSGSPLFDHKCEKVIGIVIMCNGQVGTASSIDVVNEILKEKELNQ